MIKNTNTLVINNLSKKSFKANKSRNKIAIIAIVLATLLFTSLFTIGMGMLKSNEYSTMRMVGGSTHGSFKYLTVEQYNKIKDNKLIKYKGIAVPIAIAENKELAKRQVEIKYGDKNYIKTTFATPINGDIPTKKNEILVDTLTLDLLGLPYDLNQNIKLTYKINDKEYTNEFKVSGIFEGDKVISASSAYVSKNLIKDVLGNIDQEKLKKDNDLVGTIILDVNFSNSMNIEKKLQKVIKDSGYNENEIDYGVNWAYMGGKNLDLGTVFGAIGLILLIMFTGYLIIYNIFYISIVRDIKFYGQLKTIGTTKKQIKKIIIKQALILCLIAIPIGLVLGYAIGSMVTPLIMKTVNVTHTKLSSNPIIFIFATVFSIITVLISVYKPAKIASKVSPVEAIRYTGVNENIKRKIKKTSSGAKLNNMALSNIFRNKKKTFIVIASLSLSIILLNTVYTMASGIDIDKFLRRSIGTDFTIGDTSFYRMEFDPESANALTEDVIKDIEQLDVVNSIDKMYYKQTKIPLTDKIKKVLDAKHKEGNEEINISIDEMLEEKKVSSEYYGVDRGIYKLLKNYISEGKPDEEKFASGDYIIANTNFILGNLVEVGDKVTIPFENGKSKEYTVMAIITNEPAYLNRGLGFPCFTGYLPSEEFKTTTKNNSIMTAMFNIKDGKEQEVENHIKSLIKSNPLLDYRSKQTYINEFKSTIKIYEIVGYGLSTIVGIIGILNFINVVSTNIISRKNELAMLNSIGMTRKQIKKMLILEGIYYVVITIGAVVIIGLPLTYLLVNTIAGGMSIFSYTFRIMPVILSIPILLLISIFVPSICFEKVNNEVIIETLRNS